VALGMLVLLVVLLVDGNAVGLLGSFLLQL
jgi:hypothetical protein